MTVKAHGIYYLEIVAQDAESARDFYRQVYGWSFSAQAPELGNAFVAALPDGSLCGIRAPMHSQEKPIVRIYMRVDDIHTAIHKAEAEGATVALEPVEIAGRGKVAIYLHGGVEQGLWQAP